MAAKPDLRLRQAVVVSEDEVERALLLYLQGWTYAAIARELGVHRDTASELVKQAYASVAAERDKRLADAVSEAVARLRLVQRQAWSDHAADDERERAVLAAAAAASGSGDASDGRVSMRYQSQRSQYLRVIVEAEREIARLEGLYVQAGALMSEGANGSDQAGNGAGVVIRIERLSLSTGANASTPLVTDMVSSGE